MPPRVAAPGVVTNLLQAWSAGNPHAQDDLLPLVYDELRRRAGAHLRRERKDHTLEPTELVHEAYLRLAGQQRPDWQGRVHFFALASKIMRRILVDYARARAATKRPDEALRVTLDNDAVSIDPPECDLLVLDRALSDLGRLDARQARLLELIYFGGLSETEAATAISVSRSTVAREVRSAKAWLYRRMTSSPVRNSP
jgi:RNA polymerase sigma factor (TIGR02999 family)